jgi:hypothetical protein
MRVSIPQLQPDPFGSKAIHYSRQTYDRDPTRNCYRHQMKQETHARLERFTF